MTLISTGLPTVAASVEMPVDLVTEPATRLRRGVARLPWASVATDLVAASLAATLATAGAGSLPSTATASVVAVWPVAIAVAGGYTRPVGVRRPLRQGSLVRAAGLLSIVAWATLAVAPAQLDAGAGGAVRAVLLLLVLAPVLSGALRFASGALVSTAPIDVIVAGDAAGVGRVLEESRRDPGRRGPSFLPVGICLEGDPTTDATDLLADAVEVQIWYGSAHLLDAVRAQGAEAVIVAPGPEVGHEELRRWGTWLQDEGVDLLVHQHLRDVDPSRLDHSRVGGAGLLHVRPARLSGPVRLLKELVDRLLASLLLVALAPLLGLLALLIRADSSGPSLFRQTRVGRGGRAFTVYKLRTMCQDADGGVAALRDANESDPTGVLFKMKRDPRITRLGATLRKYSLDELPQLLNVVRGEMSLIGPRPALPSEVRGYGVDLRRRLAVKPGLTGLWQVSGRSDLSWDETVRLDLQYVDNWSWPLDLTIAARTVRAVLGHKGAY